MSQPVAVGGAHVVHAHRGDRLDPRVNLCRADHKAAAAADPDGPDAFPVDEGLGTQVVHGGAEVFGVNVGQYGVSGLAGALSPERQVEGERDVSLLGHLGGVEVGALFLHGTHGVPHDQCRVGCPAVQVVGDEQVADNLHLVPVLERDLPDGDLVAGVKVVCTVRRVPRLQILPRARRSGEGLLGSCQPDAPDSPRAAAPAPVSLIRFRRDTPCSACVSGSAMLWLPSVFVLIVFILVIVGYVS